MHPNVLLAFRLLKLISGVVLIVLGAGLLVLLTGSINQATRPSGAPMAMGNPFQWRSVILVLDLVFLSLVLGGVKLAGFRWSVFGWIIIVAGMGVLCLGIWNQIDGPPIDYDSSRSD